MLVGAAVYTETLFKSGGAKGETFLDQQFWLYLYGLIVATVVHTVTNPAYTVYSFLDGIQGTNCVRQTRQGPSSGENQKISSRETNRSIYGAPIREKGAQL